MAFTSVLCMRCHPKNDGAESLAEAIALSHRAADVALEAFNVRFNRRDGEFGSRSMVGE